MKDQFIALVSALAGIVFTMVGPRAKYPGQRSYYKNIVYDLSTD